MRRPAVPTRIALVATLLTGALLLPVACTYSDREPGLLGRGAARTADGPDLSRQPTGPPAVPTNPELPVAGDTVWTSSEGLHLTSRIAVHAVRRIPGAVVLDWSVTPLAAPGLEPGAAIPSTVDFGLSTQTGGDVTALLLDVGAGTVRRPLQHRSRGEFNHCLCSPPWVARLGLRLGETRLLQVTFPTLPESTRTVDVSLGTVPVFSRVPVTPVDRVPTATAPTDLRRPPEAQDPLAPPVTVTDRAAGPGRLQSIQVDAVETGPDVTSLRWTLRSLTAADVRPAGPPVNARHSGRLPSWRASTASGPQLQVGDEILSALQVTRTTPERRYRDCLCTGFGTWSSSLRQAGGRASLTTVFPRLPAGTARVDVVLPTATTVWRVPVSPGFDGAARSGPPRAARVGSWTYQVARPPAGWHTDQWPTPLPDPAQLPDYDAPVERLLPSSSR